jgi:hypothetical protein
MNTGQKRDGMVSVTSLDAHHDLSGPYNVAGPIGVLGLHVCDDVRTDLEDPGYDSCIAGSGRCQTDRPRVPETRIGGLGGHPNSLGA